MPWRTAIGNAPINTSNAAAYTQALKDSIARDMVALLAGDEGWDAGRRGWYNDPWLGAQREAIHGMLVGVERFDDSLFPKSGLTKPFTTYVITYYNRTAGQTLGAIWRDPQAPRLDGGATQYADGSITVKLAFTTAGPQEWPAMRGALAWPMMMTANATTGQFDRPTLAKGYLMQVDIVVKDTQSAPQTGWVFTTLVYDRATRPGSRGVWDQMVPLGAQWGNDPRVDSAANPGAALFETWVNPNAPAVCARDAGLGRAPVGTERPWRERSLGGRRGPPYPGAARRQFVLPQLPRDLAVECGQSGEGDGIVPDAAGAARGGRATWRRCALPGFAGARIARLAALVPEPGGRRADGCRQRRRRLRPGADLPRAAGLA